MGATWNTSPTAVNTAIKMNVTDTSSDANSRLMELQVGGVNKLTVIKSGDVGIGTSNPSKYGGYTTLTINGIDSDIDLLRSGTRQFGMYTTSTLTALNNITALPLAFYTDNSERMRIDANGNIGIGISVPFNGTTSFINTRDPVITQDGGYFGGGLYYDAAWKNSVASQGGWSIRNSSGVFTVFTGPANGAVGSTINVSERMRIDGSGICTITGTFRSTGEVTAFYSSDRNLKTNIVPIENALGKLKQITGVMFDWTDEDIKHRGGEDGYFVRKHDTGVIAQDVETVLPEVVVTRQDGFKAIRYEKLAGIIIQAINELAEQVDELKKK